MNWNAARYDVHMRFHEELTEIVERRTTEIIKRLGHSGWLKEYDGYKVTVEYNTSCHCHPAYEQNTFPASWLFADDWEAQVDAVVAKEKAAKDETARKNQAIKDQQERKELERLQAKFAEKGQGS